MISESFEVRQPLRVVSLFSGIGGFELGFHRAGLKTILMCESDEYAKSVLRDRFPDIEIADDITQLKALPECDVVTAGWPCQDISLAGPTGGLSGSKSGLIGEVFRLIENMPRKPRHVLLENVAFALDLRKGEAIKYVTKKLSDLGYMWAYRVLDTQLFGLPQRRKRLFVLASLDADPSAMLFDGIAEKSSNIPRDPTMVGFYWTEGTRGLGWSPDAVPPLKGGSGLGIPSPPAIWNKRTAEFVSPRIEDAERLQGFPAGWTDAAKQLPRGERRRWILTGNAVSVPVAEWIGERLLSNHGASDMIDLPISDKLFSRAGKGGCKTVSSFFLQPQEGPQNPKYQSLDEFGLVQPNAVSYRALAGFTSRFEVAPLKKNPEFLRDLRRALASSEPH